MLPANPRAQRPPSECGGNVRSIAAIARIDSFQPHGFALPFAPLAAVLAWRGADGSFSEFRWLQLAGIVLCMVLRAGRPWRSIASPTVTSTPATRAWPAGIFPPVR